MTLSPRALLFIVLCLPFAACSTVIVDHSASGKTTIFDPKPVKTEVGMASWYRDHRTASGERFDSTALTAAHKKLPFGSHIRVVDLKTQNSIIVRINDRGPYVRGRIVDLTIAGARKLGIYDRGIARVRVEVLREIPIMSKPNLHQKPEVAKISSIPAARKVALREGSSKPVGG